MNESSTEAAIQAAGKNAPRLTPSDIDAAISAEYYGRASDLFAGAPAHAALGCLTICVLVLRNGFTVVGKSACVSPENFDYEIGRRVARDDARDQIWALEGYLLRSNIAAFDANGGT